MNTILKYSFKARWLSLATALFALSLTPNFATAAEPVTVYKHINFNGSSYSVGEGAYSIRDIRRSVGNDQISSIAVESGYAVYACQHSRFRGRCETFTNDTSDLRQINFNDVISSFKVEQVDIAESPITAYQHVNYRGSSYRVDVGEYSIQDIRLSDVKNDRISSFEIASGYAVYACQHTRFRGRCLTFSNDTPDLRQFNFNDVISSFKVEIVDGEPQPVTVADVVDQPFDSAVAALLPLSAVEASSAYSDTIAAGNVISQNPAAGSEVELDTVVELVISLGPETTSPSIVTVRVTSTDGITVPSVNVENAATGNALSVTNNDGLATFEIAGTADNMVLRFERDGYADQIVPLTIQDGSGSVTLDVTMVERGTTTVGELTDPATLDFEFAAYTDNAVKPVVRWEPGAFIDPARPSDFINLFSMDVSYTTIDVSNPAELEAFPGSFNGTLFDGSDTMIASLGTSEFVFTASGVDSELVLADGETATISLPLYLDTRPDNGEQIVVGQELPIWSLDETTGIWDLETMGVVVESSGTRTGLAVEAEVSHFSWWNIDVPIDTGNVQINVVGAGSTGTTVVKATSSSVASRPASGIVPIGGSVTTEIPSGSEYCFSGDVTLSNGQQLSTNTVCTTIISGGNQSVTLFIASASAPLGITSSVPADNSGLVTVNGYIDTPIHRVEIKPLTIESAVTYSATNLPAGLSLSAPTDYSAEIVGIPTQSGSFTSSVNAINADGESDSVMIQYEISNDTPPAEVSIVLYGSFEENRVNINDFLPEDAASFNVVGPTPLPSGLVFDESTGEFSVDYGTLFDVIFGPEPDALNWEGVIEVTFFDGTVVPYNVTFIVL